MNKVSITLNADKLRDLIETREYTNSEGEQVKVREIKLDIVPLKEKKFIKEGEGWKMMKTHFVAKPQTKEEREKQVETVFVGDGITFENTREETVSQEQPEEINPEDIPF